MICPALSSSPSIKKASVADAIISSDHIGSTTASFPFLRASKSSRAAMNKMNEAPSSIRKVLSLNENNSAMSFKTKGKSTMAPNAVTIKRVSQSPSFRTDLCMKKSPKPQPIMAIRINTIVSDESILCLI